LESWLTALCANRSPVPRGVPIRAHFGGRALSASINELLQVALAQQRLAELVGQMEQEAGPASPEAYDRVLAQWFEAE